MFSPAPSLHCITFVDALTTAYGTLFTDLRSQPIQKDSRRSTKYYDVTTKKQAQGKATILLTGGNGT